MFVSDQIVTEGAWEEDNVELVMRAMSLYEDAVFLGKEDIGWGGGGPGQVLKSSKNTEQSCFCVI